MDTIRVALRMTAVTLLLTGILYPLLVTAAAQVLFPRAAQGSLVPAGGPAVGSALLGQRFRRPGYFQGRPSSAGPDGYDPLASGGSNLGPTAKALRDRVTTDIRRLQQENPQAPGPVPIELVTSSGSGLDPHLSPEAAAWQVPRVAGARGLSPSAVSTVLDQQVEPRTLGLLGEPRVNVLLLNLELDRRFGPARRMP